MSQSLEACARLTRFDKSSISQESPWEGNFVPEREILAKALTRHLTACGGPYVLSISSAWGTGKSDFLERWDKWLQQAPAQKLCFRFNAWEHDFVDDPFLAFATALDKYISDNPPSTWVKFEGMAKRFACSLAEVSKRVAFPLAKKTIQALATGTAATYGADAQTAAVIGGVAEAGVESAEISAQELLDKLKKAGTSRKDVTESLRILGHAAQTNYSAPLIIMVDELDRCKPSFAVALLEVIKHLFCVPGVVFVLAIEAKQLSNCISKTYGLDEAGARAYLHKFVDMEIMLPLMNMHAFICHKFITSTFPLGLSNQLITVGHDINGIPDDFVLSDWIAAIIYDVIPSAREALQVMNQISILSFRSDIDIVSFMACAYAFAYRAREHCSIEDALEKAVGFKEIISMTRLETLLQYRNLFSILMQSRAVPSDAPPFNISSLMGIIRSDFNPSYYLGQHGERWLENFPRKFGLATIRHISDSSTGFVWCNAFQGRIWAEQLAKYLSFIETPAPDSGIL